MNPANEPFKKRPSNESFINVNTLREEYEYDLEDDSEDDSESDFEAQELSQYDIGSIKCFFLKTETTLILDTEETLEANRGLSAITFKTIARKLENTTNEIISSKVENLFSTNDNSGMNSVLVTQLFELQEKIQSQLQTGLLALHFDEMHDLLDIQPYAPNKKSKPTTPEESEILEPKVEQLPINPRVAIDLKLGFPVYFGKDGQSLLLDCETTLSSIDPNNREIALQKIKTALSQAIEFTLIEKLTREKDNKEKNWNEEDKICELQDLSRIINKLDKLIIKEELLAELGFKIQAGNDNSQEPVIAEAIVLSFDPQTNSYANPVDFSGYHQYVQNDGIGYLPTATEPQATTPDATDLTRTSEQLQR